jgi:hypothetical protein
MTFEDKSGNKKPLFIVVFVKKLGLSARNRYPMQLFSPCTNACSKPWPSLNLSSQRQCKQRLFRWRSKGVTCG